MRIVLWIGNEPNQKALANKIHEKFPIAGIVTETRKSVQKITLKKLVEKTVEKILLGQIAKAWFDMRNYYQERYPVYPRTKRLDTEKINTEEVFEFTKALNPDLIVVSGTAMIRKKLLSLQPSIGIINLHTGLSPYIKGGPNCTNWCIATNQFHLIGNTIMWIDAGIDTGNLIKTERTSFTGEETLSEMHLKVMQHAHDLYLRAIGDIKRGLRTNIPQETISGGRTFYTKDWNLKQKLALVNNFRSFATKINSLNFKSACKSVRTIP